MEEQQVVSVPSGGPDKPARGILLSAWLILIIVGNSMAALNCLLNGKQMAEKTPEFLEGLIGVMAVCGIANVVSAIRVWNWHWSGFWSLLALSIIIFAVNCYGGVQLPLGAAGLLGPIILTLLIARKWKGFS